MGQKIFIVSNILYQKIRICKKKKKIYTWGYIEGTEEPTERAPDDQMSNKIKLLDYNQKYTISMNPC